MRNDPTQTKACASLIIAIATMLASASCSPKAPVYTDARVIIPLKQSDRESSVSGWIGCWFLWQSGHGRGER